MTVTGAETSCVVGMTIVALVVGGSKVEVTVYCVVWTIRDVKVATIVIVLEADTVV